MYVATGLAVIIEMVLAKALYAVSLRMKIVANYPNWMYFVWEYL
jgi:hypothetical protein